MKHLMPAVVLMLSLAIPAMGQWSDDFQSYTAGSLLAGQGGWAGWDGAAAATIASGDHPKFAGDLAAKLFQNDDFVQEYSGYTSGQWVYSAKQYIPRSTAGANNVTFFILMNKYTLASKGWSVQLKFDQAANEVTDSEDAASAKVPLVYDEWMDIRVEIDLDANTRSTFYNGIPVGTAAWYDPASADHLKSIAAVDLWADVGGNPVYYDDMSLLVPEPATLGLLALGGLLLRRRR